jgi:hypothetical protein
MLASMEWCFTTLAYTNLSTLAHGIEPDTHAHKITHRQGLSIEGLMPWECPTTTPCSGMPDHK